MPAWLMCQVMPEGRYDGLSGLCQLVRQCVCLCHLMVSSEDATRADGHPGAGGGEHVGSLPLTDDVIS